MFDFVWVVLIVAFVIIAWFTQRGKMDFECEYEKRRDDAKAERLIAEVRKELAARGSPDSIRELALKGPPSAISAS